MSVGRKVTGNESVFCNDTLLCQLCGTLVFKMMSCLLNNRKHLVAETELKMVYMNTLTHANIHVV